MKLSDCAPALLVKVERALSRMAKSHSIADVDAGIAKGDFQLWAKPDAVVVTQIQQHPQAKMLCIFLAAGKLDQLEPMLEPLMEWARGQGCTSAYLVGRFGWLRSFVGNHGFAPTATVMERTL